MNTVMKMTSEDIDRSFGNSPYFFYNHYREAEPNRSLDEVVESEEGKKIRERDIGIDETE